MTSTVKNGLEALNHEVARALATLNYPAAPWPTSKSSTHRQDEGDQDLDVLIVGAGMCGQTAAFALRREGVDRLRVIDQASLGQEGPWSTFARMHTLRSPKHLTGPDLGIPSLSFRAWYSALHGEQAWDTLYKIDRLDWHRYLLWLRVQTGIAVDNNFMFKSVRPDPHHPGQKLEVLIEDKLHQRQALVRCRHLVLALGRDGSGKLRWPAFKSWQPDHLGRFQSVWHAADPIDFNRMRAKRVAVLGAGASAFDNAACALEAGADSVELHIRRNELPQINKSKGASYPGFQRGFFSLSDANRWHLMNYIFDEQVPPPHESVHRCERFDRFKICLNHAWEDLKIIEHEQQDGKHRQVVQVQSNQGSHVFDQVILATGFDVDLMARTDHENFACAVQRWRDYVSPDAASAFPESARFPYLGPGFEFLPRADVEGYEWVRRIHAFNWGCAISHGPLAGDIPGLRVGIERLSQAIVSRLFTDDIESHKASLMHFDDRELESTRWFVQR